ncbi:MAG TPA: cell surface protein SprA, partial [candidate division Zixibacteria bacterium]|nr:cell surface protein SprA [candidate division Zixibacteria bacterium]
PDGIVDEDPLIYRSDWGLVIFPSRTPFDTTKTYKIGNKELPELNVKVPEIYNYTSWSEKTEASQYFIQKVTTTRGSIIRLNRANIIEGSERITVNGEVLAKGTDYDIQYDFGQVTLRSEKATDPNAEIKIDFEYAPFFAVQKKSLFGLRSEYEWSKDLKFGTTFLYKTDKAQERKPKVGQETARTVIFDADLSLKLHPNFLTSVIDKLPLIETEAQSNLTISAEIAQSHPNPNVNDIAYVDDFETALDEISLGNFRSLWRHTTMPQQLENKGYIQAKMLWHNPVSQIPILDVYNRDTQVGSGTMRIFRMIFRPQNMVYDTTVLADSSVSIDSSQTKSWGGFMRYFGSPLDENRVKLFEVRMKGNKGKIHFDFGAINEDLNGNENADTEDKDNSNFIEEGEDTGLDGLMDEDEEGYNAETNPDPNGDDWYSFFDKQGKCPLPNNGCDNISEDDYNNPQYYDFLNGTEGNATDGGASQIPDKEKYSPGFTTENSYFSYVIDLDNDPDRFMVEDSKRYPEDDLTQTPWITYRIPIRDLNALDGIITSDPSIQPEWNKITHVRVWMEGDEESVSPDTIDIADWYFVQPSWKDSVIFSPLSDMRSNFVLSSVSDDVDSN